MKNLGTAMMLLAAAAMALTPACTKAENNFVKSEKGSVLHVTADHAATRSVFGDKTSGAWTARWTTSKQVTFFANDTTTAMAATPVLKDGGASAAFDLEMDGIAASGTLYAFSPKGIYSYVEAERVPGFTGFVKSSDAIYLHIPSAQTPLAGSPDESAMAITASASYSTGGAHMSFEHIPAYGRMTVANFSGTVKSVQLQFPQNVAGGSCKYFYLTGELTGTSEKTITLDPANVQGGVYWFALAPTDGDSGEMKIIVTDSDDKTYTKKVDLSAKALPFKQGQVSAFTANLSGISADEPAKTQTWDLSKDETASVSTTAIIWTGTYASMDVAKAGSGTAANNYHPGKGYSSTRFYKNSVLTITPASGYGITSIEFTATTTSYATVLKNSTWSNATAAVSGTTVTVTPTNGSSAVSATIGGTCGFTSVTVYCASGSDDPTPTPTPTISVTTGSASGIDQSEATLSASFADAPSQPYSLGFEYGLTQDNLSSTAYWSGTIPSEKGDYSVSIYGLATGTTYYYRAVVQVGGEDYRGEIKSFTTAGSAEVSGGYLELPAETSGSDYFSETLMVSGERNYSYLYDKSMYTALWVAYPLYKSICQGSASASWSFNPNIDQQYQIDVRSHSYSSFYASAGAYSRGHQLPNADRDGSKAMKNQVYYVTNQTPQLQNGFNGTIWNQLECSIRSVATSSSTDTVYVVTGATFRKAGGSETINYLKPTSSYSSTYPELPIPNYYWKVLLKVKRNSSGTVTSACTVGAWFEHKVYSSSQWANYVTSVDQIEAYTGYDFFANLPDAVEADAEQNTSWSTFSSF